MKNFSQGGKVPSMSTKDIGKLTVTLDLTPIYQAAAEASKAIATLSRISANGGLTQYLEKLRLDIEQKERDRRWKDDPLQLKARYLGPVVEHFRAQTIEVLGWMLERVKG
jgi:hypothetical protein